MSKVDYNKLKKNGFMQQKQKDIFSLRVEVIGGCLTAQNLMKIAAVAEQYGDGHVHLTSRQSVEIPFIKLEDIEAVKEELALGACKPGVCGPEVRTVTACQGSEICASGNIVTHDLAVKLHERYLGNELPHKFKIGVTGCQNNCLKAEENDLGVKGALKTEWISEKCIHCSLCVRACKAKAISLEEKVIKINKEQCSACGKCAKVCPTAAWTTEVAYIVSFGGLFGNHISKGFSPLPLITTEEQLLRISDAAINFFKKHGNSGERFKFTIDRVGQETFIKEMEAVYNA